MMRGRVSLPQGTKDTAFFSARYGLGLDWYAWHFRRAAGKLAVGEFSATYFDHGQARRRIAELLPHCKIICTLRDPVERLYSHYRQLRHEGWVGRRTLRQALDSQRHWCDQPGSLVGASRYARHLQAWRELFGRSRVLVLIYDELVAEPWSWYRQVEDFLEIDAGAGRPARELGRRVNRMDRAPRSPHLARRARRLRQALEARHLYRATALLSPLFELCFRGGGSLPALDPADEAELRAFFAPEVEGLERLLDRDLSRWKTARAPLHQVSMR